uniref:Putative secreted protein n=1 Tax=Anopheles triannulatus TaxID=58253 RepID=A0A2M4B175_9DIPT
MYAGLTYPFSFRFLFGVLSQKLSTCATKRLLRWSLTMAPVCARPVSPVTMHHAPCSRPSLDARAIRV